MSGRGRFQRAFLQALLALGLLELLVHPSFSQAAAAIPDYPYPFLGQTDPSFIARAGVPTHQLFNVSFDPGTQFIHVFTNSSLSPFVIYPRLNPSTTTQAKLSNFRFSVIQAFSSDPPYFCLPQCDFIIDINTANLNTDIQLSVWIGSYNTNYNPPLHKYQAQVYATLIPRNLLDILISLTPDTHSPTTDLDLYVSTELDPLKFIYPTNDNPNHGGNARETFMITEANFVEKKLYIIIVVASRNTTSDWNNYSLVLWANYRDSVFFGLSMFGVVGALTVLVLCLFSAAAVIARRRRAADIRAYGLQQQQAAQARAAEAATPQEIEALDQKVFRTGDIPNEDARCAICLADYENKEPLRYLPCHHHFHSSCVDTWLKQRKHCPLCQQDIAKSPEPKSPGGGARVFAASASTPASGGGGNGGSGVNAPSSSSASDSSSSAAPAHAPTPTPGAGDSVSSSTATTTNTTLNSSSGLHNNDNRSDGCVDVSGSSAALSPSAPRNSLGSPNDQMSEVELPLLEQVGEVNTRSTNAASSAVAPPQLPARNHFLQHPTRTANAEGLQSHVIQIDASSRTEATPK